MKKLSVADLGTLENYQQQRPAIRRAIIDHKKNRRVPLGPNASLHFEDYLTMKYQVQEMMRAERLSDDAALAEEIEAYNPLIPDGSNLKATFMIEYPDETVRKQALKNLIGIEHKIAIQIEGFDPVRAIANEDLERSDGEKTSAVHFLRFEFTPAMIAAARAGAAWHIHCDHPAYQHSLSPLPEETASSLSRDFAEQSLSK
ncbi:MAG: DUF3501 family protein [Pseudomonadales bacterium]|nr:DUF3501 family protein [Pseudomonadales bacterium]